MFIIIIGCGRMGRMLALDLSKEGHNVTVIDKESDNLKRLGSGFNGVTIEGLGIDEETLIKAGIQEADVFLALSSEDNVNLMAAQIAQKIFKVKRVIARNYQPELESFYKQLGLEIICPSNISVEMVKERIL